MIIDSLYVTHVGTIEPTPFPERVGAIIKVWLVPAWQTSRLVLIIFNPKFPALLIIAFDFAENCWHRTTPCLSQSPNFLRSFSVPHRAVP